MPRRAIGLTAAKVKTAARGRYGDGGGLYLLVRGVDLRFWLFRYKCNGKMREMGLGPAAGTSAVSLADARAKARQLHDSVRDGRDPLADRETAKAEALETARQAASRAVTFRDVADAYIAAHEASWRNAKHRQQWTNTLRDYVFPSLGDVPVERVETGAVMRVLESIWLEKPETASRVRGRIEVVLDYAKAREWRTGENPARWRGHISNMLPKRAKIAPVSHLSALPWREVAPFMRDLDKLGTLAAFALRFTVLTAARSTEVLGATWSEFDIDHALWTVPGARMKSGKEHRVPLTDAVLAVLSEVAPLRHQGRGDFVFPSARKGRPLSRMLFVLGEMGRSDLTIHGFRSTFRDWAAETGQSSDVAEAALAHTLGNRVQAAYQRGDLLERRRRLMEAWASFCIQPASSGEVIPLRGRA